MRPRSGKNRTIDYRSVLSGTHSGALGGSRPPDSSSLSALTASQYAAMFPDYFRRQKPDIGISASGRMPGRQLPSGVSGLPGVGHPTTAAARAARRTQPSGDQPGTGASPGASPGRASTAPIWQGGTPEVNRSGNLSTRAKGGHPYLAQQRVHLFEKAEKDPHLKAMIMGLLLKENNEDPTSILEAMANRAVMNNQTLEQQMESGFFGPYNRGKVRPVYRNQSALDAWEKVKGGSDQLAGRTDQGLKTEHKPAEQHEARYGQGTARIAQINGEWYSDMGSKGVNWRKARDQDLKKWEESNPGWNRDDIENVYLPPLALLDKRNLSTTIAEQVVKKEEDTKVIPGRQLPTGTGSVANIIAKAESGNKGYNAYNKGTTSSARLPTIDFSTLTVGELMAMQFREEVFAVGKYQIIPTTMKAAIASLKISSNEKFTPELQEKIFSQYLTREKRPAIENYIKGSGNLDAARLAIAQEWAGIAYNGRSYYAGDSAGNAAHAQTEGEMKAALERAKTVYADLIKQGVDPNSAYSQALISGAQQAPAAQSQPRGERKQPIYIGDSVAVGLGKEDKGAAVYATVGHSPSQILDRIKLIAPEALKGSNVVFSSGLLNNVEDSASVEAAIDYLKKSGANVTLVGGPTGNKIQDNIKGANDALQKIAEKTGIKFYGGYDSKDGVHPESYTNYLTKISAYIEPPPVDPVQQKPLSSATRVYDDLTTRATGEVNSQGEMDLYSIAQSKRVDANFGGFRSSGYNCGRGTGAIVDAMFGSNYTRGGIGGNANHFAGNRPMQFVPKLYQNAQPLPQDYLKDTSKIPIGAVIASAGGSRGDGHIQVWNGKEWVSDFRQGQRNSVTWANAQSYHSHTLFLPKPEAYERLDSKFLERQDLSGATRDIMRQHEIAIAEQARTSTPLATATPVQASQTARIHPIDELWTSLERAPTKEEVDAGIKNGIKVFDFDMTKDGAKEISDYIKSQGGQVAAYDRGPGNRSWNEANRPKEDVLASMISNGQRLQHLDNQDQMSATDLNWLVEEARKNNMAVIPKNAPNFWNNYLKTNPDYMKDVPHAIVENAHTYDPNVLKKLNEVTDNKVINMAWQNEKAAKAVLEATKIPSMVSPKPEVPTKDGGSDGGYHFADAKKVKENRYGGQMRGENVVMLDKLTGKVLGSVGEGESVRIQDGQISATPYTRNNPDTITDHNEKTLKAHQYAASQAEESLSHGSLAAMVPTPPSPAPVSGAPQIVFNQPQSSSFRRAVDKVLVDNGHFGIRSQAVVAMV